MRGVGFIRRNAAAALAAWLALACPGVLAAQGAVEIERGRPIEIRALLSATVVPAVSAAIRTAIELAIADFGPIHGHPVSVRFLDEKCSGPGGRAAAEAVVAEARVVGVIGTLCSGAAVAASPVLGAAGLATISPANTSPVLTSDLAGNAGPHRHPGYYRVADNDLIEAGVVAQFSYDALGLRKVATVHDGDAYTRALANAFAAAFRAHGGAVPAIARVDKGQTDMAGILARLAAAEPDGLFVPLFAAEAAALIRQAAGVEALSRAAIFGGAATLQPEILALPEARGVYFTGPDPGDGANANQATGKRADEVLAAFAAAAGGPPASLYWVHGYDATTLLLAAIRRAAAVDGDRLRIHRAALRAALDATAGFQGLLGTLTCDRFGDCGIGRSAIHRHTDPGIADPARVPIVYRGSRGSHLPHR